MNRHTTGTTHRSTAAPRHAQPNDRTSVEQIIRTTAVPTDPRPANRSDIEQRIRTAAYALYEKRGRQHGQDLADWFEAERIVQGRQAL